MMNDASHATPGNVWYHWPGVGCAADHQLTPACFANAPPYDVAIIGAGVIGCALAYGLSQYLLRVVLIDRAFDVGEGTSKGNSAIIHTGFDAEPGSLESQLVTSASRQWPALAERLKIPFMQVSALMLALTEEQHAQLPALREKALANGVDDVELVSAETARRLEPHISSSVRGGLVVPRESIVDPFTTCVAYAEVARRNGVDVALGWEVAGIGAADANLKTVFGGGIELRTRLVINASGFGSRKLVDQYHGAPMDLNPRRGQFAIYDRDCRHLVERILLPIPTKQTKGMLIAPTVFGNLIAGPTAEDLPPDQVEATGTTREGLAAVRDSAVQMCPELAERPVIATYAGLRCNCAQGSYWIRFNDGRPGVVTLAGIRSTGLTASISTAQYVINGMVEQCGLTLQRNERAVDSRSETRWPGWWRRPFEDPARLAERPEYGRIVCSCENISQGELWDALDASPGVATLDGLKRRTRVLMGRCQGFNCCVPAAEMISRHFQIPLGAVTKRGPGTEFIAQGETALPVAAIEQSRREPLRRVTLRSHYRVIVVGAGPAGLGAAIELSRRGIAPVLLVDRAAAVGGVAANYEVKSGGVPTFVQWNRGRVLFGKQIVARWQAELDRTNVELQLNCQVIAADRESKRVRMVSPQLGHVEATADAVLFACGAREKSRSERGWIVGQRPARQFFTMQLLQLVDGCHELPMKRPLIVGSDLIAYSAAAKLRAAGANEPLMTDRGRRPVAGQLERLYFRRWTHPNWRGPTEEVCIVNPMLVDEVRLDQRREACDGVVISGELLPNSELIAAAGLEMSSALRIPTRRGANRLSAPGWFVAGAEVGGFHGADWCYRDGRRAAKSVVKYLPKASG